MTGPPQCANRHLTAFILRVPNQYPSALGGTWALVPARHGRAGTRHEERYIIKHACTLFGQFSLLYHVLQISEACNYSRHCVYCCQIISEITFYTLHNAIATNMNNYAPPLSSMLCRVNYTGPSRGSKGVLAARYLFQAP